MNRAQKNSNRRCQTLRSRSSQNQAIDASREPVVEVASPYRLRDFHIVLQRLSPDTINLQNNHVDSTSLKPSKALANSSHSSEVGAQSSLDDSNKGLVLGLDSRKNTLVRRSSNKSVSTFSKELAFKNDLFENAHSLSNESGRDSSVLKICQKSQNHNPEDPTKTISVSTTNDKKIKPSYSHTSGSKNDASKEASASLMIDRNSFKKRNGHHPSSENCVPKVPIPKNESSSLEKNCRLNSENLSPSKDEKQKTASRIYGVEGNILSSSEEINIHDKDITGNKIESPHKLSSVQLRRKGNPKKRKITSEKLELTDSHRAQGKILESTMQLEISSTPSKVFLSSPTKDIKRSKPRSSSLMDKKITKKRVAYYDRAMEEEVLSSKNKTVSIDLKDDASATSVTSGMQSKNCSPNSAKVYTNEMIINHSELKEENKEDNSSNYSDEKNIGKAEQNKRKSFPTFLERGESLNKQKKEKTATQSRKKRTESLLSDRKIIKSSKHFPVFKNKIKQHSSLRKYHLLRVRSNHSCVPLVKEGNVGKVLSKAGRKTSRHPLQVNSLQSPKTESTENINLRTKKSGLISGKSICNKKKIVVFTKKGDNSIKSSGGFVIPSDKKMVPKKRKILSESACAFDKLNTSLNKHSEASLVNPESVSQFLSISTSNVSDSISIKNNKHSVSVTKRKKPFKKLGSRVLQKNCKLNNTNDGNLSTQPSTSHPSITVTDSNVSANNQDIACENYINKPFSSRAKELADSDKNKLDKDKSLKKCSVEKKIVSSAMFIDGIHKQSVNHPEANQKPQGNIDDADVSKDSNQPGMTDSQSNSALSDKSEIEGTSSLENKLSSVEKINSSVPTKKYRKKRPLSKKKIEMYQTEESYKSDTSASSILNESIAIKSESTESGNVQPNNNSEFQNTKFFKGISVDSSSSENNLSQNSPLTKVAQSNVGNINPSGETKMHLAQNVPDKIVSSTKSDDAVSLKEGTAETLSANQLTKTFDLKHQIVNDSSGNKSDQTEREKLPSFQSKPYNPFLKTTSSECDNTYNGNFNNVSPNKSQNNDAFTDSSPKTVDLEKKEDPPVKLIESIDLTSKKLESKEITWNKSSSVEEVQNKNSPTSPKNSKCSLPTVQCGMNKHQDEIISNKKLLLKKRDDVFHNTGTISHLSSKMKNRKKNKFSLSESTNEETKIDSRASSCITTNGGQDFQIKSTSVSSSEEPNVPFSAEQANLKLDRIQSEGGTTKISLPNEDKFVHSDVHVPQSSHPVKDLLLKKAVMQNKEESYVQLSESANLSPPDIKTKDTVKRETTSTVKISQNKTTSDNSSDRSSFSASSVQGDLNEKRLKYEAGEIPEVENMSDSSKSINRGQKQDLPFSFCESINLSPYGKESKETSISKINDSQETTVSDTSRNGSKTEIQMKETPTNISTVMAVDSPDEEDTVNSSTESKFIEISAQRAILKKDKVDAEGKNVNEKTLSEAKTNITSGRFDVLLITSDVLKSDKLASLPSDKALMARYLLEQLTVKQSEEDEVNPKSAHDISCRFAKPETNIEPHVKSKSRKKVESDKKSIDEKLSSKLQNGSEVAKEAPDIKKNADDHAFKVPNKAAPRARKKPSFITKTNTFLKPKTNESITQLQRNIPNVNVKSKVTKCHLSGTIIPRNMATGLVVCYSHKNVRKISLPIKLSPKQTINKNLPASFMKTLRDKTVGLKEKMTSEVSISSNLFESQILGNEVTEYHEIPCKLSQISETDEKTNSKAYSVLNKASFAVHEDHRYFRTPPSMSDLSSSVKRKESVQCQLHTSFGNKEIKIPCKLNVQGSKKDVTLEKIIDIKRNHPRKCEKCLLHLSHTSGLGTSDSQMQITLRSQKSDSSKSESTYRTIYNNPIKSKKTEEGVFDLCTINKHEHAGNLPKDLSQETSSTQKYIPPTETRTQINKSSDIVSKTNLSNDSCSCDHKEVICEKLELTEPLTLSNIKSNVNGKEITNHPLTKRSEGSSTNECNCCKTHRNHESHSIKLQNHSRSNANRSNQNQSLSSDIRWEKCIQKNGKTCCLESVTLRIPKPEFNITNHPDTAKHHLTDSERTISSKVRPNNDCPDHEYFSKKCVSNEILKLKENNSEFVDSSVCESTENISNNKSDKNVSQTVALKLNCNSFAALKSGMLKKCVGQSSTDCSDVDNSEITKQTVSANLHQKRSYPLSDTQNPYGAKKSRKSENLQMNSASDAYPQNHSDSKQCPKTTCSNFKEPELYTSKNNVSSHQRHNDDDANCSSSKPNDSFKQRLQNSSSLVEKNTSSNSEENISSGIKNKSVDVTVGPPMDPSPLSQDTSSRKDLAAEICEFVKELRRLDTTTADALNNYKKGINNEKVNQELKAMIPREGLNRKTHSDRPPEWFLKFITNFRKQELWRLHQMFKIHDHLMRIESAKLNLLEKVYEELKGNEKLTNERS